MPTMPTRTCPTQPGLRRTNRWRALALVLGVASGTAARAQCAEMWHPVVGVAGYQGGTAQVLAVSMLSEGDWIVAGSFYSAGGHLAANIARYHPASNSWSTLGAGANGLILDLLALPGGIVIVGGTFTTAGGLQASGIARFDSTSDSWSTIGTGVSGSVFSLAPLLGGDVLIGGNFLKSIGFDIARNIVRLNPTTGVWTALGQGVSGTHLQPVPTVATMAVLSSGDVIVGGDLVRAGSVTDLNRVARYNPTTGVWSPLGSGVRGGGEIVYAVAPLPNGDIVAGGNFTMAGGVPASNLARYNPTSGVWTELGSGTNGTVQAFTASPNGDVIVGGNFTLAGGLAAGGIARYSTTTNTWSTLGVGTDHQVGTLAPVAGTATGSIDLMVGGMFTSAGGAPAGSFARYTLCSAFCPADLNFNGTVDFFDYDAFVTCFEGRACPPGTTADFDGDGSVDFFDYDAFVVAFESPC